MKNILISLLLAVSIAAAITSYFVLIERVRCDCLGNQPYISTKWNGECLTYIWDPYGDFNGEGMVLYLFNAIEECR